MPQNPGTASALQNRLKIVKKEKADKTKHQSQPEPIICQVIAVEPYIRRSMLKLGWQLIEHTGKI
jgi:hypothetical protein